MTIRELIKHLEVKDLDRKIMVLDTIIVIGNKVDTDVNVKVIKDYDEEKEFFLDHN